MENNGKPKVQRAKVLETVRFTLPDDATTEELYPNVYELLTPKWLDGVVTRQAGSLSVKPDGSMWRVSITCPTEGLQTSFNVSSLVLMLDEMEKKISSGSCHWAMTWELQKKNRPVA